MRGEVAAIEGKKNEWGLWVRARIELLLELWAADPDRAKFFLIAPASVGDRVGVRHHEAMRELVGELVAGAPRRRAGKSEPEGTREQALAGGISRLVVRKLNDGEAETLGELAPALSELVLRPYVGDAEAARVAAG